MLCKLLLSLQKDNLKCKLVRTSLFDGKICICLYTHTHTHTHTHTCCAKSLQLCPTLCNPVDCSLPGSSVHGILHARILEWVAMPSSRYIYIYICKLFTIVSSDFLVHICDSENVLILFLSL